ncbi:hypothetical protein KEM52_000315 [Ascosphaera acerosa]|nr:hypothetical protein KEM52_000315 [Ascosphaera acerosa]
MGPANTLNQNQRRSNRATPAAPAPQTRQMGRNQAYLTQSDPEANHPAADEEDLLLLEEEEKHTTQNDADEAAEQEE